MKAVDNYEPANDDPPVDERAPILSEVALVYLGAVLCLLAVMGACYFIAWLVVPSWR